MSAATRVFVRLYEGATRHETEDEVLELPPPPLTWKGVITAMVAAVGKQDDYQDGVSTPKARLFLLPTEAQGLAAELNARSLRFGIRENDRFVICLKGEDYQQPSEGSAVSTASSSSALATPSSTTVTSQPSISPAASTPPNGNLGGPPRGSIGGGAPPGGMLVSGKKGNKRYRSISGKMAAIKSLGDKGLISNDDRGHLKDLLLNNDSPALQEALDKYNNTGDFQAVKDLLMKEMQNPSAKRNTGDWLSESFVNDITLNFSTTPPAGPKTVVTPPNGGNFRQFDNASSSASSMPMASNPYGYQAANNPASVGMTTANGYPQNSPVNMNGGYASSSNLVSPVGGTLSNNSVHPTAMGSSGGYQPTNMIPDLYNQPQISPTNMYGGGQPQINLPLRDRSGFMKREYGASPVHNMMGMAPHAVSPAAAQQMTMNSYGMQQAGYGLNQTGYAGNMGYGTEPTPYNPYDMAAQTNGMYNPYQQQQQQQQQYVMNRYGYGMVTDAGLSGYNFYAAGYGFGKSQLRAGPGGKWTTAPPMPSYPPPCSKEEKREKIAKWLKKRENRNWSNKPSYPVRHSIAKNRKRGEDGRFITKARLAEMAAEEEAAKAIGAGTDSDNDGDSKDLSSPTAAVSVGALETPVSMVTHSSMPAPTRVL